MINQVLSICIPTYNRPDLLERSIRLFLDEAKDFHIPVYISDDSTNNETEYMVKTLKDEYPLIFYKRNKKPQGIEGNFFTVLNMSDTKYKWLLGDDDSLVKGAIKRVLNILEKEEYDAVIVNACRLKDKRFPEKGCRSLRVKHISSKVYTDKDQLLSELGWHTTFMSTIIYSDELIKHFNRDRYTGSIFPQFVLLYDHLGHKENIRVYFDKEPSVYTLNMQSLGGANWFKDIVKIFTKDWYEAVFSLPETYSQNAKLECVKNHDRYTGVFNFLKLLYIRSYGYIDLNMLKKYEDFIEKSVIVPKSILYLAALFPRSLATFMRDLYLKIKGGY